MKAAGVRAIQILSSGFAEQAGEGASKQRWLMDWAARTGIPAVGPNCFGLMNAANQLMAVPLDFHTMKVGGISSIFQSGQGGSHPRPNGAEDNHDEPLSTLVTSYFARGDSGFGGPPNGQPKPHQMPGRTPTGSSTFARASTKG